MVSFRIIFVAAIFFACAFSVQASVYPNALKIGKEFLAKAVKLANGRYTFYNVSTKKYLLFTKTNNVINPATSSSNNKPGTWTYFNIKVRGGKNSTIEFTNGSHKCLSAAWYQGTDSTAVFYECLPGWLKREYDENYTDELESVVEDNMELARREALSEDIDLSEDISEDYSHLEKRVSAQGEVRKDKMTWIFIPVKGQKNTYLVVSTAHMWDMYPVCLFSTRSPNAHYTGMTLKPCPTKADSRFYYVITKH